MSWSTEMVVMIRHLINDLGDVPIYTTDRLQEVIIIAGQQVQQQCSFQNTYQFNLGALTIVPDPATGSSSNNRDEAFMWLVSLRCCGIIARAEAKISSGNAFIVKDANMVMVDASRVSSEKRLIADKWEEEYENARWIYQMSNRPSGQGIFGPFSIITPAAYGEAGGFQYYAPRDRPIFR